MPAIADWLLYTRRYLDATYRVAFVRVLVVLETQGSATPHRWGFSKAWF